MTQGGGTCQWSDTRVEVSVHGVTQGGGVSGVTQGGGVSGVTQGGGVSGVTQGGGVSGVTQGWRCQWSDTRVEVSVE